jgi:hypothetical protein
MEPLLVALVPGVLGGVLVALLIASRRTRLPSAVVSRRLAAPTPALINIATIRVEGIGGLGMVAAVVAVAIADPRIRVAIMIAAVLGAGLAFGLIVIRRRTGALPSSGDGPDDRSMFHLDSRRPGAHAGEAPASDGILSLPERLEGAFHVP